MQRATPSINGIARVGTETDLPTHTPCIGARPGQMRTDKARPVSTKDGPCELLLLRHPFLALTGARRHYARSAFTSRRGTDPTHRRPPVALAAMIAPIQSTRHSNAGRLNSETLPSRERRTQSNRPDRIRSSCRTIKKWKESASHWIQVSVFYYFFFLLLRGGWRGIRLTGPVSRSSVRVERDATCAPRPDLTRSGSFL